MALPNLIALAALSGVIFAIARRSGDGEVEEVPDV
jgi:hypothetical protein